MVGHHREKRHRPNGVAAGSDCYGMAAAMRSTASRMIGRGTRR